MYKVRSKANAWEIADRIFPTDYEEDARMSERAGYKVYVSTSETYRNSYTQIDDLGDRLEVIINGESTNIWIEEYEEYQIADALSIIDDAIYKIDDNINYDLAEVTGIKEARNKLYEAYDKLAGILKEVNPNSDLFAKYGI